jgi:hypothetical protein
LQKDDEKIALHVFSIGDMFEVGCLWLRCLEMPRPRPQQFSVKIFTSVILLAPLNRSSLKASWVYIYRERSTGNKKAKTDKS